MLNTCWLEQVGADVPNERGWLSEAEAAHLTQLRFAGRRSDWLLGRWTAKQALAAYFNIPADHQALAKVEIRPALSGAPEVFFENHLMNVTISLSHRAGRALCAVTQPGIKLGCDLELIEPRSDAFIADYFTAEEQDFVAQAPLTRRLQVIALVWSAKESALKALHEGLRLDTRSVIVTSESMWSDVTEWKPLRVRYLDGSVFCGWWEPARWMVRTVVADLPSDLPISLPTAAHGSHGSVPTRSEVTASRRSFESWGSTLPRTNVARTGTD